MQVKMPITASQSFSVSEPTLHVAGADAGEPIRTVLASDSLKARAANTIARAYDALLAARAKADMIVGGTKWRRSDIIKDIAQAKRSRGDFAPVSIDDISTRNMRELYRKLHAPHAGVKGGAAPQTAALDDRERAYLSEGLKKTYYATHFTDADLVDPKTGTMKLDSRQRLAAAKIPFAEDHVDSLELCYMNNDGHTFFALEPGETPQKFVSRFGKNTYRVPLNDPEFRHAFGAHLDSAWPEFPQTRDRFARLPAEDHDRLKDREKTIKFDGAQGVFSRKHLIPSILLRHIADARTLSPDGHKRLMDARTDADYNRTINGLLRPQILNPRATYIQAGGFKFYREHQLTGEHA